MSLFSSEIRVVALSPPCVSAAPPYPLAGKSHLAPFPLPAHGNTILPMMPLLSLLRARSWSHVVLWIRPFEFRRGRIYEEAEISRPASGYPGLHVPGRWPVAHVGSRDVAATSRRHAGRKRRGTSRGWPCHPKNGVELEATRHGNKNIPVSQTTDLKATEALHKTLSCQRGSAITSTNIIGLYLK